jgi:ATP-dependent Zn protease
MVTESFQQYQLEVFFGGFGVGCIVTVVIIFIIFIIRWWVVSRRQAAEEREVNREIFRRRAERERQQGKGKSFLKIAGFF